MDQKQFLETLRSGSEQRVMSSFVTLTASPLKADAQSGQGQIMEMFKVGSFFGRKI
jgi:hypothetical protein